MTHHEAVNSDQQINEYVKTILVRNEWSLKRNLGMDWRWNQET